MNLYYDTINGRVPVEDLLPEEDATIVPQLTTLKKSEMLTKRELFAKDILCALIIRGDSKSDDVYTHAISRADRLLKALEQGV